MILLGHVGAKFQVLVGLFTDAMSRSSWPLVFSASILLIYFLPYLYYSAIFCIKSLLNFEFGYGYYQ